jgi:signal transduction histidine kinase
VIARSRDFFEYPALIYITYDIRSRSAPSLAADRPKMLLCSIDHSMDERSHNSRGIVTSQTAETWQSPSQQAHKMIALGRLASGAVHELNNLLQGVVASLDLTRRLISAGRLAETDRFIDSAIATARRAALLNKQLDRFSRSQPGAPDALSIDALVTEVDDLLHYALDHRFKLQVELDAKPWEIHCDATQAEAAIIDLVLDAKSAIPDGGTLLIQTRKLNRDTPTGEGDGASQYVCLAVTATGKSLAPPEPRLAMARNFAHTLRAELALNAEDGTYSAAEIFLPRFIGPNAG